MGLSLFLVLSSSWAGGGLQVRTTQATISTGQRGTAIRLGNSGDAAVTAQISVKEWQQDGEDRLLATDAVALSPNLVRLEPGEEKTVRLVRRGEAVTGPDLMYRILIQQIPDGAPAAGRVAILMNYSLPLYVRGVGASAGRLNCSKSGSDLVCRNSGGTAIRLGRTAVEGGALLKEGLFGYVLPGSTRAWPGVLKNTPMPAVLVSTIDGQDVRVHVAAAH